MSWWALLRWEWFKLRSRKIIWVLLAALVLFSTFVVALRFGDYQFKKDAAVEDEVIFLAGSPKPADEIVVDCEAFLDGFVPEVPAPLSREDIDFEHTRRECELEIVEVSDRLTMLVDEFTLPGAVPTAIRWTALVGVPVFAFLTVLVVGSEYSWGTLRTVLMRGAGRWRLLSVKLTLIALVVASTWVAVLAAIFVTSSAVTPFASEVSHGEWTAGLARDVGVDVARAWIACLPFIALAALLSILFSSWAGGMLAAVGLSTGVFFIELFSMGRLIRLFDGVAAFRWFGTLAEYDLGWNTAAWMFGEGGEPIPGFALAGAIGVVDYPVDLHAVFVLAGYTALFLTAGFWIFRRRDVSGPAG
jgi:ABC-type transport system involved in multi-copper enzyme maturation permease subunit